MVCGVAVLCEIPRVPHRWVRLATDEERTWERRWMMLQQGVLHWYATKRRSVAPRHVALGSLDVKQGVKHIVTSHDHRVKAIEWYCERIALNVVHAWMEFFSCECIASGCYSSLGNEVCRRCDRKSKVLKCVGLCVSLQ